MAGDEGFRGGGTPGGRWGCGLAALFLLACTPLGLVMMMPMHVEHPDFWPVVGLTLATAAAVGLGARAVINRTARCDEDKAALWAILLLVAAIVVWVGALYVWALGSV